MAYIGRRVESLGRNVVILNGIVTLGASGAVASQNCHGFTVAATATETGRYTITLTHTFQNIFNVLASLEISADTASLQSKGIATVLRGVSASGKVAYLQFTYTGTAAAAGVDIEPEDSAKIRITVFCDAGMT